LLEQVAPPFSFGAQVWLPHEPELQITSHAHALLHLRSPQAVGPLQTTSQLPEHVTSPQAVLPTQLIMQVPAVQLTLPQAMPEQLTTHESPPQETSPHEPPVGQLMMQEKPVGQVTSPPLPSIKHMSPAQVEHALGQLFEPEPEPEPPPPNTQ